MRLNSSAFNAAAINGDSSGALVGQAFQVQTTQAGFSLDASLAHASASAQSAALVAQRVVTCASVSAQSQGALSSHTRTAACTQASAQLQSGSAQTSRSVPSQGASAQAQAAGAQAARKVFFSHEDGIVQTVAGQAQRSVGASAAASQVAGSVAGVCVRSTGTASVSAQVQGASVNAVRTVSVSTDSASQAQQAASDAARAVRAHAALGHVQSAAAGALRHVLTSMQAAQAQRGAGVASAGGYVRSHQVQSCAVALTATMPASGASSQGTSAEAAFMRSMRAFAAGHGAQSSAAFYRRDVLLLAQLQQVQSELAAAMPLSTGPSDFVAVVPSYAVAAEFPSGEPALMRAYVPVQINSAVVPVATTVVSVLFDPNEAALAEQQVAAVV